MSEEEEENKHLDFSNGFRIFRFGLQDFGEFPLGQNFVRQKLPPEEDAEDR